METIWRGRTFLEAGMAVLFCGELAYSTTAATTKLATRYSPLHPQNNQNVTFSVRAENSQGISKLKLYVYEYAWTQLDLAVKRSGGRWGLVKTWNYPSNPAVVETNEMVTGFPANTFVS